MSRTVSLSARCRTRRTCRTCPYGASSGRWDLTAIGVNQVIGSAIFLLPADVARQIGAWGPIAFLAIGSRRS